MRPWCDCTICRINAGLRRSQELNATVPAFMFAIAGSSTANLAPVSYEGAAALCLVRSFKMRSTRQNRSETESHCGSAHPRPQRGSAARSRAPLLPVVVSPVSDARWQTRATLSKEQQLQQAGCEQQ